MIPSVIERWLISGYVEHGRSLPAWLQARVDRSTDLGRYLKSLRRIESALTDAAAATTRAPSPALAVRIAGALAAPRVPARRSLPIGWLGVATIGAVVLLSLLVILRPERPDKSLANASVLRDGTSLPALPSNLRGGPLVVLTGSVERPISQQLHTLAAQTRQSIRGYIRALPSLPLGAIDQSKMQ